MPTLQCQHLDLLPTPPASCLCSMLRTPGPFLQHVLDRSISACATHAFPCRDFNHAMLATLAIYGYSISALSITLHKPHTMFSTSTVSDISTEVRVFKHNKHNNNTKQSSSQAALLASWRDNLAVLAGAARGPPDLEAIARLGDSLKVEGAQVRRLLAAVRGADLALRVFGQCLACTWALFWGCLGWSWSGCHPSRAFFAAVLYFAVLFVVVDVSLYMSPPVGGAEMGLRFRYAIPWHGMCARHSRPQQLSGLESIQQCMHVAVCLRSRAAAGRTAVLPGGRRGTRVQ